MNIKMRIIFAALLAVFIMSCDEDTDFKGLYKKPAPPEIGDTRTFECDDKPDKGTEWNIVSEYTQTWDGYAWQPPDTDTVYNEYSPSTTSCQYKCAMPYIPNGYGACVEDPDPNNKYKLYQCKPKPEGAAYEWNTVSEYWQKSTDQGFSYSPVDDLTTEYNLTPSTTSCQYKCASGYMWDGYECKSAPTDTRVFICNPLPSTNGEYAWNTVDRYNQNSYDHGSTWVPADDPTTDYNETPSTTSCQFKCNTNYTWNGSACAYMNWESYNGYQWFKSPEAKTYNEAQTYCYNIGANLPNIDQLRMLVTNCSDTQSGGACGVTSSCVSWSSCRTTSCESCAESSVGYYSIFTDEGDLWSSTSVSDQTSSVFLINFNNGSIIMGSTDGADSADFRCVK